jgi:hypothetical protein
MGKVIFGFLILFHWYFSMARLQAICDGFESTERPSSAQLFAVNSFAIDAKVISSVVQTGVNTTVSA